MRNYDRTCNYDIDIDYGHALTERGWCNFINIDIDRMKYIDINLPLNTIKIPWYS